MGCTAAVACEVTLPLAQYWESLHHRPMSAFMPRHTILAATSLRVALIPGCAKLWMAVNTAFLLQAGTRGRGIPVDQSQSRFMSPTCTDLTDRDGFAARSVVSGQTRSSEAMAAKSTPPCTLMSMGGSGGDSCRQRPGGHLYAGGLTLSLAGPGWNCRRRRRGRRRPGQSVGTTLFVPAMWRKSLVYSAMYASCRHCLTVHGSEDRCNA